MNYLNKYQEDRETFDLKGNVKKCIKTFHFGGKKTKSVYEFDSLGNVITHTDYDHHNKKAFSLKHEYNEKNQVIGTEDSVSLFKWQYVYDKEGRLVVNTNVNTFGTILNRITLEYENGLMTYEIVDNRYHETCNKYYYEYDSKKRITKEIEKTCEDELEGIAEYEYDDNDKIIRETNYDMEGEYEYAVEMEYNKYGDQIVVKSEDLEYEHHFDYDYDEHENWIRWYVLDGKSRRLHYERDITYY